MPSRIGSFAGQSFEWLRPLGSIHPADNVFNGYQFHEALRERMDKLTTQELEDLEQQIRELEAVMRMERDEYAWNK